MTLIDCMNLILTIMTKVQPSHASIYISRGIIAIGLLPMFPIICTTYYKLMHDSIFTAK